MSILTLPQGRIPIGSAMIQGQRIPVEVDIEWMRYFITLTERAGGVVAPSNLYQTISSVSFASMGFGDDVAEQGDRGVPGKDGVNGKDGAFMRGEDGSDGEDGIMRILRSPYRAALDATRALDTTYTNTSESTLLVIANVRCAVTLAGGTAYVQAKMDTATPPTVAASGLVGIQAGLLGEDNTHQIIFTVNPGGTYIISSTTANGTTTLGKWFEITI